MLAIFTLITLLSLIFGSLVLIFGSIRREVSGRFEYLSKYPILFLLYRKEIEALAGFLLFKIAISAYVVAIHSIFRSSNHFIISMDILFLFSIMMLILYHILKIAETSPER